jgi:transcription initiation factor TFIID TATA-box-binding protein
LQRLIPELNIVNVVATGDLKQFINLERLASAHGFLYDRTVYHCAYLQDQKTRAKVIIFASGKLISVGAKSIKDAKHDLDYASRKLAELGFITTTKIQVQLRNIVATGDIGQPIDIEKISMKLPNIIYEPEQFPGAVYYAEELEGASILIFANGKVVFAGLKRTELLEVGKQVLMELHDLNAKES